MEVVGINKNKAMRRTLLKLPYQEELTYMEITAARLNNAKAERK